MGGFKKIFQDRAGEQRHALKRLRACLARGDPRSIQFERARPTADSLDPLVDLGIQRVFFVHPVQLRALVCTVLRHSPVTFPKT